MLHVQRYLQGGKTHRHLFEELAVRSLRHDSLPLVIINYDQLDSPKTNPIVRECRGLVLHAETHELIARSFPRFFNWGEMTEEMKRFDFSDFTAHTKEDGSLALLFFFDGQWRLTTRGSFAQDLMRGHDRTWHDAICEALAVTHVRDLAGRLDESLTYVCEFCSPYNTVVRRYPEPALYLLSAYRGEAELPPAEVDELARAPFRRPARHHFHNIEGVRAFLRQQAAADPTFEGVVIRDRHGSRWKVKSPTYLGLHHLSTEGPEAFAPKHLLPFILAGEGSELLTYYPQLRDTYEEYRQRVEAAWEQLAGVWAESWQIADQKAFAMAIQGRTPFTGLLFALRKAHGANQTRDHLRQAWRDAEETILKMLFR
jgi:RNA ligase